MLQSDYDGISLQVSHAHHSYPLRTRIFCISSHRHPFLLSPFLHFLGQKESSLIFIRRPYCSPRLRQEKKAAAGCSYAQIDASEGKSGIGSGFFDGYTTYVRMDGQSSGEIIDAGAGENSIFGVFVLFQGTEVRIRDRGCRVGGHSRHSFLNLTSSTQPPYYPPYYSLAALALLRAHPAPSTHLPHPHHHAYSASRLGPPPSLLRDTPEQQPFSPHSILVVRPLRQPCI